MHEVLSSITVNLPAKSKKGDVRGARMHRHGWSLRTEIQYICFHCKMVVIMTHRFVVYYDLFVVFGRPRDPYDGYSRGHCDDL